MEPMQFVEIFTASLMMPPIFVGRFARWGCRTAGQPKTPSSARNQATQTPLSYGNQQPFSSADESVTRPFTDGARRFPTACRTNTQAKLTRNEIHKSAMLLAQLAFARVVAPVHKLVFKILMDAQNF